MFCTHASAGVFDAPALSQCKTVLAFTAIHLSVNFSHSCRAARRVLLDGFTSPLCLHVRDYPTPENCKFLALFSRLPPFTPGLCASCVASMGTMLVIRSAVNFTHFFALLLRTTYYRLFHGLLTLAFARGFLSPSKTGRFAPSRWYSPRRLGYSVSRRRSHVSGVRASTTTTVYTINTNLLLLFPF